MHERGHVADGRAARERERLLGEFGKIAKFKGTLGQSSEALLLALQFVSDTDRAASRVTVQVGPVPLQAPPQPANCELPSAAASSVTLLPTR